MSAAPRQGRVAAVAEGVHEVVADLDGDVQAVAVAVRVPNVAPHLVDEVERRLGDVEVPGLEEGDLGRDGVVLVLSHLEILNP